MDLTPYPLSTAVESGGCGAPFPHLGGRWPSVRVALVPDPSDGIRGRAAGGARPDEGTSLRGRGRGRDDGWSPSRTRWGAAQARTLAGCAAYRHRGRTFVLVKTSCAAES